MQVDPIRDGGDPVAEAARQLRRRDVQETAAKVSKRVTEARTENADQQNDERTRARREENRVANQEAVEQAQRQTVEVKQRETQENRNEEDKRDPGAGNIINVVV